jgi:tRNA/tmRNA/rRNA uracil-C5-methylase (TrmA/RlmC/RlmD family)
VTATCLQSGQRLELDITDIAFGGDGIGRVEGFVVFVPFVLSGERVEVEVVDVKKRYATADLIRVITPATQRVEPRCQYYRQCAGCQYQHVDYRHQLELKRKQIIDIFQRIGGIKEPPIEPVVGSPREYGYRNKIVVHGPGAPGFWTVRGRSVIPIARCEIAREEINQRLTEPLAVDKHLTLRSNSAGQTWLFTESNEIIEETILGKTLRVPLGSFFQVNREVIELALQHARQIFTASGCSTLVDAYCGIGLFALLLADVPAERAASARRESDGPIGGLGQPALPMAHIYGIEEDARAIQFANENAERLSLERYDFYPGKTERLLYYTLRQCKLDETCLVLDPPRSGCGKPVLKTLREQKPRKIIYVSCAPPMLARDIKELLKAGYRLERITPFDMFPQTAHCEAVAELALS